MIIKFGVDEEVAVKGKIINIGIDETGIYYDLEIEVCDGVCTFTFKEDQILGILEESDGIKT